LQRIILELETKMRNLVFLSVVWAFCAATAFGQSGLTGSVLSSQPSVFTIPDHPQHASQTGMAREQNILEHSESVSGHGERPLWEVMPEQQLVCLGDVARAYRQKHAMNKKANVVWKNE
jgi:hypothetical protein